MEASPEDRTLGRALGDFAVVDESTRVTVTVTMYDCR